MDSGNGETLGEYVKRIRIEKDLTVEAVSEKSGRNNTGTYNISAAYVNKIENENPNVSAPKLDALAKGLGVSRAEIYAVAYKIEFDVKIITVERFARLADGYAALDKAERDAVEPLLTAIELTIEKSENSRAKDTEDIDDPVIFEGKRKTVGDIKKSRKNLLNSADKKK